MPVHSVGGVGETGVGADVEGVGAPISRLHLKQHRGGWNRGLNEITRCEDDPAIGIGLAVLRLSAGERITLVPTRETAWLLMSGALDVHVGRRLSQWSRRSLFDEPPSCLHAAAGTEVVLEAHRDVELTRYESASTRRFETRLFGPDDVREEHRGRGQVRDACHRLVRTIFDRETSDPSCELVLGEVVTLPGRWSSYPPHHHAQPELYHYRFTDPRGYGHAELGDEVVKVRHFDTVQIVPPLDHAQVAAPGYAMFYSWVIRHLPSAPYVAPEFTEAHRWVMEPGAKTWWPRGME